jgi:formylglycine-generating enzyme required for sulfatase activity
VSRIVSLVFISYRRDDSGASAGRIYDRLVHEFGAGSVFMDIEGSIAHGADFPSEIERALSASSALLVVIGRNWLTCEDAQGQPRIDDKHDWVVNEIATALERGIFILPVLVDRAEMPLEDALPERIRDLARRQACEVRASSWQYDVGQVIDALKPILRAKSWKRWRTAALLALAVAAIGAAVSIDWRSNRRPPAAVVPAAIKTGSVALAWSGSTDASWRVVDARDRTVAEATTPPKSTTRVAVPVGEFFVVVAGFPELRQLPVRVVDGAASTVTPRLGQLQMTWGGAAPLTATVADQHGAVVRSSVAISPKSARSIELGAGSYSISLPRAQPRLVTISAGETVIVNLDRPAAPSPAPSAPYAAGQWKLPNAAQLGFVEIPAGSFLMGSDRSRDRHALQDEAPQHRVDLPAFFIGRYEVTVEQYKACIDEGGCTPGDPRAASGGAYQPVRFVSWNEATAYGNWLETKLRSWSGTPPNLAAALNGARDGRMWHVRLPTEAEWERAARGTDGRIYPWGDAIAPSRANYAGAGSREPKPVGSYPGGATQNGLLDMSGNVWEWTRSRLGRYPYNAKSDREDARADDETIRVIRGGSFQTADVRAARRNTGRQGERTDFTGFRLVIAPP